MKTLTTLSKSPYADVAVLAVILAFFVVIRLPLYLEPGLRLGWNSDAAVYGLMARVMAKGESFPLFFWGQDYLGTLTTMWTCLAAKMLGIDPGPLALRVGTALEIGTAIVFYWVALRRIYGSWVAHLSAFWLAAGPAFLFRLSYAPLSAEQMFFIGSILFWFTTRGPFRNFAGWLGFGLLTGLGLWAHRGSVFVTIPALVMIAWFDYEWRTVRRAIPAGCVFLLGIALGYVPALIGDRQVDQRLYLPLTASWSFGLILQSVRETLTSDLWLFLGADSGRATSILGALLVVFFLVGLSLTKRVRSELIALGVVVMCFAFWLLSPQASPGAVRYLVLALPIVYAIAARGILSVRAAHAWRRAASLGAAVVITLSLSTPRITEARAVAAGKREQFEHWPGGFDPRPALERIERERYRVCYADFWLAYKLEWLSESGVEFIPYRSVNRTQARSLRLASMPGRKCFVMSDGTVRTLSAAEESELRADTEDLIRGRPGRRGVAGAR